MAVRAELPVPVHPNAFTMYKVLFQSSVPVHLLTHPNFEVYSDEPVEGNNCNQSFTSFWLNNGYNNSLSQLRNNVTDEDLDILLAVSTQKSGVPESYLDHLLSWPISVDRCAVRFSFRFSAMWVHHRNSVVWFCVVDGEFFAFSLGTGEVLEANSTYSGHAIPHITLATNGVLWSEHQQFLVDNFESDNIVRALSAAIMICCNPSGTYNSVPREMLPSTLRTLRTDVVYDTPVDEDIVTVLADPRESNHNIVFRCGGGYWTMSNIQDDEATMSRIEQPLKSTPYKERGALLMPFLFR